MSTMEAVTEQVENNHIEEENNVDALHDYSDGIIIGPGSVLNKSFPLKYKWNFHFLSNEKNLDWMQRLTHICDIHTVEEFWAFIDRIRPPSVMSQCDYSLFKDDIRPVWEQTANVEGGRMVYHVKQQRGEQAPLNDLWLRLLQALIGDFFGPLTESICGAVCASRQKGSKISIWTTDSKDESTNKAIGLKLKELWSELMNPNDLRLFYESHAAAQTKQSSQTPPLFTM